MAGPFNRGDTIINKHFTLLYFFQYDPVAKIQANFPDTVKIEWY